MLPHFDELDRIRYRYYFQFTLTPYDGEIASKNALNYVRQAKRSGADLVLFSECKKAVANRRTRDHL